MTVDNFLNVPGEEITEQEWTNEEIVEEVVAMGEAEHGEEREEPEIMEVGCR